MTAPGPLSGAVSGNPAAPAHVNRNTARRVVPLFRPYRAQVATVVGGVQSVVTTTASTILANVVIFTSTIVAMVILSWQLTVVAVITVPAFFWLTKMVGERRRQVARSTQESLAAMSALSEETLSVSGVLLAKAFGNQARDTTRYHQENQRLADLEVRQQMIGQGFYAIVQSFLSITPAAVYLIAGLLLAHGTAISAGTVVAFTTLQTRLYFPIGQLLQVSVELRSSLALFDRIFEYLDVVPDIVDAPDAVDLPATSSGGRVALDDVYFRYPGAPQDALAGVSFEADPGQLVALVGPSGAGKTTISYLIPRLYDVTGGAIEIDGIDVRRARQASLAAVIGFVTQESYLFHDTILANLQYGRPDASRPRSRRRRGQRSSTTGSWSSPKATTPSWASGATGCPAGRSSGWPSPGCGCTTRAS